MSNKDYIIALWRKYLLNLMVRKNVDSIRDTINAHISKYIIVGDYSIRETADGMIITLPFTDGNLLIVLRMRPSQLNPHYHTITSVDYDVEL